MPWDTVHLRHCGNRRVGVDGFDELPQLLTDIGRVNRSCSQARFGRRLLQMQDNAQFHGSGNQKSSIPFAMVYRIQTRGQHRC